MEKAQNVKELKAILSKFSEDSLVHIVDNDSIKMFLKDEIEVKEVKIKGIKTILILS